MTDQLNKLKKSFESLNKNLYRTNKIVELYSPLHEILNNIVNDSKIISDVVKKSEHFEKFVEDEIKKRELISLFKKMNTTVSGIKDEINVFFKEIQEVDNFLEKFRSYRTYSFPDTLKTKEFLEKMISSFDIKEFILKFSMVGNIDLNEISLKVNGKRQGIDIVVFPENINLIFGELLKSKSAKFRLVSEAITIYFEKENVLYIEGQSKKVKLCDIEAQSFSAKIFSD